MAVPSPGGGDQGGEVAVGDVVEVLGDREFRDVLRHELADSTWKSYAGAVRRLRDETGSVMLSDLGLARYCLGLWNRGLSAASVEIVVAAVRWHLRATEQDVEAVVGARVGRVLAGIRRGSHGRGRGRVEGLRWEEADRAVAAVERSGRPRDLRNAAIVAVMSDALLRVSEVCELVVGDVEAEGEGTLLIGRSKTDQQGEGAVMYLGESTVWRVRRWIAVARLEGTMDGLLFQRVTRAGRPNGRLSRQAVRTIVREVAAAGGYVGRRVSGHSLRVGSARSLAERGASLVEMQDAGRWKSPVMPQHYVRGQLARRGAVARLRYGRKGPDRQG